MIKPEYIHSDITAEILGAAFELHKIIGCGFSELVYHRAMIFECGIRQIETESEISLPIFYKNVKVGARRVDLLVKKKVVVELKAFSELNDAHLAQAINYLEPFNLDVGLLINFGAKSVQYKRVIHPRLLRPNNQ